MSRIKILALATSIVVLVGLSCVLLWPREPELSDYGYELSLALYSACNRQSVPAVKSVEKLLNEGITKGTIDQSTATRLNCVVELAREQRWVTAGDSLRKLLEHQVKVSNAP